MYTSLSYKREFLYSGNTMKYTSRIKRHKSAPNITGKQTKDYKTSPGSPGTNMNNPLTKQAQAEQRAKVTKAFISFLKSA